jgi:hypothetical protein
MASIAVHDRGALRVPQFLIANDGRASERKVIVARVVADHSKSKRYSPPGRGIGGKCLEPSLAGVVHQGEEDEVMVADRVEGVQRDVPPLDGSLAHAGVRLPFLPCRTDLRVSNVERQRLEQTVHRTFRRNCPTALPWPRRRPRLCSGSERHVHHPLPAK